MIDATIVTVRTLTLRPGVPGLMMNIVIAFGGSQTICTNGRRMKNRNGRRWSFWHNDHQRAKPPNDQSFPGKQNRSNRQGFPEAFPCGNLRVKMEATINPTEQIKEQPPFWSSLANTGRHSPQ